LLWQPTLRADDGDHDEQFHERETTEVHSNRHSNEKRKMLHENGRILGPGRDLRRVCSC
jgi:hypothetical protein